MRIKILLWITAVAILVSAGASSAQNNGSRNGRDWTYDDRDYREREREREKAWREYLKERRKAYKEWSKANRKERTNSKDGCGNATRIAETGPGAIATGGMTTGIIAATAIGAMTIRTAAGATATHLVMASVSIRMLVSGAKSSARGLTSAGGLSGTITTTGSRPSGSSAEPAWLSTNMTISTATAG